MERDGIAVLPIVGSLVRRGTWLDAECGMMSYGLIRDATAEILMDPSVRGLMLEYDSGGGEANGCFDCADFIRSASVATGKPVWAHANEIMCSAAYALGSSADRIWVARTAEVGSIGVLGAHVDVSEADKAAGVKWTYIYAGEHKTDGNSHEPLGEGPRARMQADVDHLYEMFLELSSQNRGMTVEELRATKADIYRGSLAVEAGLADEVGTLDEALEAFAEHVDDLQTSGGAVLSKSQLRVGLMVRKTGKTVASADAGSEGITEAPETGATEAVDAGADDVTEPEPAEEEVDDAKVAAIVDRRLKAETARCSGLHAVAQQASRLGVSFNAVEAINKGMSVDVARAKVLAAAADGDAPETSAIAVPKNVTAAGASGQRTMSADAKKSAWGKAIKRR
jgi:signal peptide peptidase SppA